MSQSDNYPDFSVTDTHAFDGTPATRLVIHEELLLKIYDADCSADAGSFTSGCFVKDGALGTLSGARVFVGMDSDAQGVISALVDPKNQALSGPCSSACLLERIGVALRRVLSESIVRLSVGAFVAARHDAHGNRTVVGHRMASTSYCLSTDPYPGYRVESLAY